MTVPILDIYPVLYCLFKLVFHNVESKQNVSCPMMLNLKKIYLVLVNFRYPIKFNCSSSIPKFAY